MVGSGNTYPASSAAVRQCSLHLQPQSRTMTSLWCRDMCKSMVARTASLRDDSIQVEVNASRAQPLRRGGCVEYAGLWWIYGARSTSKQEARAWLWARTGAAATTEVSLCEMRRQRKAVYFIWKIIEVALSHFGGFE
jgi:hypothetical protein